MLLFVKELEGDKPAARHDKPMFGVIPQLGSSRSKPLPHWPDSGWVSISLEKTVPKFTVATLINYFLLREVHHDKTAASDFSSVSDKAYRLYFKGHVHKLEVKSVAQETFPCKPSKRMFYVRAKVHPEMKQKNYDVRLAAIVEQGAGEAESVVVT